MNNNSNLLLKKRYNIIFLLSLSAISLSTLIIIIALFINYPDVITLKWPITISLLPVYLIIRLIFLKIESNKNIKINKIEEIVKLLLFVYLLTFISIRFFPLNKKFFADSLTINFLSFNTPRTSFSIKFIIKNFIENFLLFIPLGFLVPIIITKFRSMYNCAILSLLISIIVALLEISLYFIDLDFVNIISLDLVFINVIGTLIGYKLYYFLINHNFNKSLSYL